MDDVFYKLTGFVFTQLILHTERLGSVISRGGLAPNRYVATGKGVLMKHIILLTVLVCFSHFALAQKGHLGQWTGQSSTGELVKFKFLDNGQVLFERSQGGRVEGKTTGARMMMNYQLDYSKDPHWLDLISKSDDSTYTYKYLADFINTDSLKIATPKEFSKRPANFSDAGEIYSLRRVKPE